MKVSQQDYSEMLRGYTDSKRRINPAENRAAYRQGWCGGYRKQDKYQQSIAGELIG